MLISIVLCFFYVLYHNITYKLKFFWGIIETFIIFAVVNISD